MVGRGIWLTPEGKVELRDIPEEYTPGPDGVLIKVEYSGINPADIGHAGLGFNECVAGYDVSGTVVSVGKDRASEFKPGDKVTCFGAPKAGKPKEYGAHQSYHVGNQIVEKVPDSMPMQDAACIMVVTYTAADALLNHLELPWGKKTKVPVLIWGGASAVGCSAIQLAKELGCYPIITTASDKNRETLQSLGADVVIDYKDKDVVDKIKAAAKEHTSEPLEHVFDTVVKRGDPSSTVLCESCCPDGGANAKVCAVLPAGPSKHQKKWGNVFACRGHDVDIQIPHGGPLLKNPARPEWQAEMDKAVKWTFANYGKGYKMPNVVIVKGGEEGIKAIQDSIAGKASLQKFVIQHPL